jgi:uncharacterized protein (TIGR03790 family)
VKLLNKCIPAIIAAGITVHIAEAATPAEVLLVVNADSPASQLIGRDYEILRGVHNVVQVHCIDSALSRDNETLSAADFSARIEAPVSAYLKTHPGINFIVLTKGIPIRVDGGATGEGFGFDGLQVSVDGALASLDYARLPGARQIAFDDPAGFAVGKAWLNRYWNADEPFTHAKFGGYIVTRLDAFTVEQARNLIARGITAERQPRPGTILLDVEPDFGIDDPSSPPAPVTRSPITAESSFGTWNADMVRAGTALGLRGIPVLVDQSETFVGGRSDLLGYFSWGSNDNNFSHDAYESLAFLPGAIGDTAVSTSALTMLPPGSDGQSAVGDLVAHGITGVKGYIDEPLLQAIASPSIALDRYTRGYTLGESLAAASRFVGWTDLIIGDPLTHPYPKTTAKAAR